MPTTVLNAPSEVCRHPNETCVGRAAGPSRTGRRGRPAPLPRCHWLGVCPKAAPFCSGLVLQRVQAPVGDVAIEHPGHSAAHLLAVGVDAVAAHMRHGTAVHVEAAASSDGPHLGVLPHAHRCETLARTRTEWLLTFGCVHLGQAHLDHLRVRISGRVAPRGQRVAIVDADDDAKQEGRDGWHRSKVQRPTEYGTTVPAEAFVFVSLSRVQGLRRRGGPRNPHVPGYIALSLAGRRKGRTDHRLRPVSRCGSVGGLVGSLIKSRLRVRPMTNRSMFRAQGSNLPALSRPSTPWQSPPRPAQPPPDSQ